MIVTTLHATVHLFLVRLSSPKLRVRWQLYGFARPIRRLPFVSRLPIPARGYGSEHNAVAKRWTYEWSYVAPNRANRSKLNRFFFCEYYSCAYYANVDLHLILT